MAAAIPALFALAGTAYSVDQSKSMAKKANVKAPVAPVMDDKSSELAMKRKQMLSAGTGAQKTVMSSTLG
jgi:hypothetical protein